MASYKEIFGTNIEVLASDPANPVAGQVWYNSTDNLVKGAAATTAGAWATGGNTNQVRSQAAGSGADNTSALVFAGYTGTAATALTESYNGTSWTEVNDVNTARRYLSGCGTNTAALATGGYSTAPTAANELWNGTSWTEVGDLTRPATRTDASEFGTTTAALYFGGEPAGALTELWNGTSWTEVGDLNTGRFAPTGFGDTTAGLAVGGKQTSPATITGATELWNGTSWTTSPGTLNTARSDASASQASSPTTGIVFIGTTGDHTNTVANTELWNGTSWTEDSDLSTARYRGMGAGTGTSAICATGYNGTARTSVTEEWTGPGSPLTYTFTDS